MEERADELGLAVASADMPDGLRIIVLEGDETGQELLEQALRVLDPDVIGVDVELEHYDLSLENRREHQQRGRAAAAARAMREARLRPQGGDDHARGRRRRRHAPTGSCARRSTAR